MQIPFLSRTGRYLLLAMFVGAIAAAGCAPVAAAASGEACAGADLILANGRIVTMDDRGAVVEALAVRDGRIVAAGSTAQEVQAPRGRVR